MLYGFIGIMVVIIFIVIMMLYARARNEKKSTVYRSFAKNRGFEYYHTTHFLQIKPVIKGELENLHFEITEVVVGYGKSKKTWTTIHFYNSPFDFDFKISKEGFLSKMGKVFGFKDIEFRDEKFDKKFLLKSTHEEKFRQLLTDQVRAKLMDIADDFKGSLENISAELKYSSQEEIMDNTSIDKLDRILAFMTTLQHQKL